MKTPDKEMTVDEILDTRDRQLTELKARYARDRLGWSADDGSAEQDLYVRERNIKTKAKAQLQQLIEWVIGDDIDPDNWGWQQFDSAPKAINLIKNDQRKRLTKIMEG